MLSCGCLNVVIESETDDFQRIKTDSLNLTEDEKSDPFFQQELQQVHKLGRISKEHSGLVVSTSIGSWITHRCLNCDVFTHAIHKDRGSAFVLASTKLLTTPTISTLRSSELYSNIFNVLVHTEKENGEEKHPENLSPDVQLALSALKQRASEVLERELAATEERVRQFTESQFAALEKLREKAHKEHKILAGIIIEKRSQPLNVRIDSAVASPPNPRLTNDNVPVLTANTNSPSDKPKNKLIVKTKNNANRPAIRQMSTPLSFNSLDAEGLFQLEEMDDGHLMSSSEHEDSENEVAESGKNEMGHMTRNKSLPMNMAKSLPVNIPVFMSPYQSRGIDEDHDDILPPGDEHPADIAASIKALAKSVHGDTVFGDLPRPRFSTQI